MKAVASVAEDQPSSSVPAAANPGSAVGSRMEIVTSGAKDQPSAGVPPVAEAVDSVEQIESDVMPRSVLPDHDGTPRKDEEPAPPCVGAGQSDLEESSKENQSLSPVAVAATAGVEDPVPSVDAAVTGKSSSLSEEQQRRIEEKRQAALVTECAVRGIIAKKALFQARRAEKAALELEMKEYLERNAVPDSKQ